MIESDFPTNIGKPARRALEGAGYFRLDQVAQTSEVELLKLHGMGPKALELIRQALLEKVLTFEK